ncbi:MAG: YceI family protein [Pseudomonadota bacterium]
MMKRAFSPAASATAAVLLSLTTPAWAEAPAWTIDYGASSLGFSATQNDKAFDGTFGEWTADINFDPEDLAGSSIAAEITLKSAKTGDRQRDRALPGKDWFNVKETPVASFTSDEIVANGDGYIAKGTLDLRGVEKPLELTFDVDIEGNAASASGEAIIIRTDHEVGQGEFATGKWVGVEVAVTLSISASK